MVWHKVNKIDKLGAGWVVRYSILTCCHELKRTKVFVQKKKPSKKQIEDAINNKG